MKILITLLFLLFVGTGNLFAQFFGEMDWQKKKIPALITEVPQPADITLAAISNKLAQRGYKPSSQKGALQYKGIQLAEIGLENYDLVIRVDKKGRRSSETSVVYFAISRGNENFITGTDDPALIERIKAFGTNFVPWATEQSLEVGIQKQEQSVNSAEKRLSDLESESSNLEKRKAKLEEDIQTNKRNIERQKAEVENQKKALEVLRAKRKN